MGLFVTVVYHDRRINHIPFTNITEAHKYMDSMREESISTMIVFLRSGGFPVVLTSRVFDLPRS